MHRSLVFASLAALAVAGVVEPASACSPSGGTIGSVTPAGDTHPANAAIVIEGRVLSERGLEATIDGEPAALMVDALRSAWNPPDQGYDRMALRLSPEPTPGQVVRVSGEACASWGGVCPLEVAFTAGPPATEVLPPVDALWFDWGLEEPWGDPWISDSCGSFPTVAELVVHVRVPEEARDGSLLRVWATPAVEGDWGARAAYLRDAEPEVRQRIGMDAYRVGDPVTISRACVHAQLVGSAGEGPVTTTCAPCRFYDDAWLGDGPGCFGATYACPSDIAPASPSDHCVDPIPDAGAPDAGAPWSPDGGAPSPADAGAGAPVTYGCAAVPTTPSSPLGLLGLAALAWLRRRP